MAFGLKSCLTSTSIVLILLFYVNPIESSGKSKSIVLNETNWQLMLSGEWMVEFYAPWCPACKSLEKGWQEFSSWSKDLDIKVGQIDVTEAPGLSGRFMVTALPTIFHVLDGEFRQYRGARDKDSFIEFIEENKWKLVEPISGWKSPSSVSMSVVAQFFRMSQLLRSLHNRLMEEYGLPSWGSYLLFAVATILLGAILGLVAVCTLDFISPCNPNQYVPVKPKTKSAKESEPEDDDEEDEEDDDDLAEDDIVDDSKEVGESNATRKRKPRKDN